MAGEQRSNRDTKQRRAIRGAFVHADRPLSPPEVHQLAMAEVPELGIATVYRALKRLQDNGEIVPVDFPGELTRYELAGKDHHHHFLCRSCDRAFELEGCPGRLSALLPAGFELQAHDLTLYGRCAECVESDRTG
ncbi:MAG: transcriptional repressor [Planctomycetota bacterium]